MKEISLIDLKNRGHIVIELDGDEIMVIYHDGNVYAVSNICTHAYARLSEGSVGNEIECPLHGARFSLNGKVLSPPASEDLKVYKVIIEGDIVKITK